MAFLSSRASASDSKLRWSPLGNSLLLIRLGFPGGCFLALLHVEQGGPMKTAATRPLETRSLASSQTSSVVRSLPEGRPPGLHESTSMQVCPGCFAVGPDAVWPVSGA